MSVTIYHKLHTGFQLIPTLNGLIAIILQFFTQFDFFAGQLCHSG